MQSCLLHLPFYGFSTVPFLCVGRVIKPIRHRHILIQATIIVICNRKQVVLQMSCSIRVINSTKHITGSLCLPILEKRVNHIVNHKRSSICRQIVLPQVLVPLEVNHDHVLLEVNRRVHSVIGVVLLNDGRAQWIRYTLHPQSRKNFLQSLVTYLHDVVRLEPSFTEIFTAVEAVEHLGNQEDSNRLLGMHPPLDRACHRDERHRRFSTSDS